MTEKECFKMESIINRTVIPAAGFYEWSRLKKKIHFTGRIEPLFIWLDFMIGLVRKIGL